MSYYDILVFFLGWLMAAIMPILVETGKFISAVIRDATQRRELISKAKNIANERFNNRQSKIKSVFLGGDKNGKKKD
jgi:hypothetical protein